MQLRSVVTAVPLLSVAHAASVLRFGCSQITVERLDP